MRILDVFAENQKEAIDLVKEKLSTEVDLLDVSLAKSDKKGLFKFLSKKLPSNYYVYAIKDKTPIEVCIRGILYSIIEKMGYDVEVKSIEKSERNKLLVTIESSEAKYIIGKKGTTLEAIQLLLNILIDQFQRNSPKILLNIASYREKREEYLISLSQRIAAKVLEQQKEYLLMPLNPYERRIIHQEIQGMENLETVSIGNTQMKRVKVRYTGPVDREREEQVVHESDDSQMGDLRDEQSKFTEEVVHESDSETDDFRDEQSKFAEEIEESDE